MTNLLKYATLEDQNVDGKKAYDTYIKAATPFIQSADAKMIYGGDYSLTIIGPEGDREWDKILIVEYPSVQAFLKMVTAPDYPSELRKKALQDSRLFISIPEQE